ncbi:MAG: hypothetical protein GXP58_02565 [Deltaproteobacteria bacterium]|nr:hypothetical protein [Deltaproteobacteria bacterium]
MIATEKMMTPIDFTREDGLSIHPAFLDLLDRNGLASFSRLYDYPGGEQFKKNRFRSVYRITLQDRAGKEHILHVKRHFPPLETRLKSIFTGLAIRDGAKNEWEKILRLEELGIHTMTPVAFGSVRKWGLPYREITVTEHLYGAEKLEHFLPDRFGRPPLSRKVLAYKRRIISETACWAARFHRNGFYHQDFYLGHIFIQPDDDAFTLHLIDLQRVRESRRPRSSRILKDLSQINFSALQLSCLTRTDRMRFIHAYLGRTRLTELDKDLIRKIESKTLRIAAHTEKMLARRGPAKPIRGAAERRKGLV